MYIYLSFLRSFLVCSSLWHPEMLGFYLTIDTVSMLLALQLAWHVSVTSSLAWHVSVTSSYVQLITYDHRSDNVEFTVQKVALGQVSLPNCSSVSLVWHVLACSVFIVNWHLGGTYCVHLKVEEWAEQGTSVKAGFRWQATDYMTLCIQKIGHSIMAAVRTSSPILV
jgi:hypothetical protein